MAKVCPECGREFGNSSVRCPICKIDLVSDEIDNSEQARKERLELLLQVRAQQQAQTRSTSQQTQRVAQQKVAQQDKQGPSALSITALVFSLLGCLSFIGVILGIIDLCVNRDRKKVCSILSLVFGVLIMLGSVAVVGGSGSSGSRSGSFSRNNTVTTTYNMGQTWVVDGQWELTVTSVRETSDRNQFSEKKPAAVYLVDYTYKNIGYEDRSGLMDGLFISMDDMIVDSTSKMGYTYPGDKTKYAKETPVGATCEAQECIGVDHAGTFKIHVSKYDGNGKEQKAIFTIVP